jgi:hypothetical protein
LERIFSKFPPTFYHPGFRFEKIRTQAEGSYRKINLDLAGNVILDEKAREQCQRQELCIIRCWIELQTTEPN